MQNIEELYKFADAHDACGIREKLKEIVPEYEPQDSETFAKRPLLPNFCVRLKF